MRGRKPKPAHLRVVSGTRGGALAWRGDDGGDHARGADDKPPTCPAHLSPTAKAEWKRLARHLFALGTLAEADRAALAAYCQAYGRWVEAEKTLAQTPTLIKLPSGYIQPSPWLGIANKQLEIMKGFMAELGLSPVSRSRVTPAQKLQPKPWEFD
ncbi:MAG TPA: phage terminase small subunit P27 family [Mesorhizobium sp.]|jgi:P27 family predicted phage terminase small subunit|nr:phage terminase small subunit P27 family [Mesorhizobium sp.]